MTYIESLQFSSNNIYIRHSHRSSESFVLDYRVAQPVRFVKGGKKFPTMFRICFKKRLNKNTESPSRGLKIVETSGFHALPGACPQRRSGCATGNQKQIHRRTASCWKLIRTSQVRMMDLSLFFYVIFSF